MAFCGGILHQCIATKVQLNIKFEVKNNRSSSTEEALQSTTQTYLRHVKISDLSIFLKMAEKKGEEERKSQDTHKHKQNRNHVDHCEKPRIRLSFNSRQPNNHLRKLDSVTDGAILATNIRVIFFEDERIISSCKKMNVQLKENQ